jgi:hypothetical protein
MGAPSRFAKAAEHSGNGAGRQQVPLWSPAFAKRNRSLLVAETLQGPVAEFWERPRLGSSASSFSPVSSWRQPSS